MNNAEFKLDRVEIYNWGTFNGRVWTVDPRGFSALLTGENGSGKSTLVDALLTLLVPNVKRNYNLASGNEKKERTELTYVRGAYAREQNELGSGQTKYLRKEEDYSILLARFQNQLTSELISIGQFFWFEQATLHKFFFVSHTPISINETFQQLKQVKEARNRLKNTPHTTIFNTFSEYQAYFIRYVGLRSEKGLDLFNQIVAIKEINRLTEFVRKHMLNVNDTQELLNSLYANYQNLELAYQAILLSKHQLDDLNPIVEEASKFELVQQKLAQFQQEQKNLPYQFAKEKQTALIHQQSQAVQKRTESEVQLNAIEFSLKAIHQQKMDVARVLSQEAGGQELERLDMIVEQYEEKKKNAQKHANDYAKLAKTLGLIEQPSVKEFSKNIDRAEEIKAAIQERLASAKNELYLHKKQQEEAQAAVEALMTEVRSLKNRKNRLPMNLIHVREELMETLGVASVDLPFIAELIKVQDSEWEGAIEKLLHTFSLRLLVPSDLYADTCKFLNRKEIGMRLVFQKIDEHVSYKTVSNRDIDENKLFHKLEFKPRSTYTTWLKDQIIKNYDYTCVKDLSAFQKQFKAITPQGLIKHGANLNEKDDRFSIKDKSRFILGWDSQERIDVLLADIQTHQKAHDKATHAITLSERAIQQAELQLIAIQTLRSITDISVMDWQTMATEIENIKKRKALLTGKNQKTNRLQQDVQKLDQALQENQHKRDQCLKEIAVLTNAEKEWHIEIKQCDNILKSFDHPPVVSEWLTQFMKKRKTSFEQLNLRDYALWEKTAFDELSMQAGKFSAEKQSFQGSLIRKMTQFKSRFSEQAVDLDTTLESLPDYIALHKKLHAESLPEHERRFRKLLSKSVMNDMAAFKSTLDLAYEDIENTIQELNHVLIGMHYSPQSYVQLQLTRSIDQEVREFQKLLKLALFELGHEGEEAPDNEICFERIKTLLDRLKNEERWCKNVTDVRNWANFSVIEKIRDTHEQKNFYSDSAGLSGGQKAKLAFTILGSAIAYQYGLHFEGGSSAKSNKVTGNSFRFIVVDEAFSKSDEKNSRYAMELFHALGLQVMVVTPKDKMHVVEPYIRSVFLTTINEEQNYSSITRGSINPYNKG